MASAVDILLSSYVAAPISFVAGIAYKRIKSRIWDSRGLRQAISFAGNGAKILIPLSGSSPGKGMTTAYGDMLAVSDLLQAAQSISVSSGMQTVAIGDATDFNPFKGENLIIIGGGGSNRFYLEAITSLEPPLHFWDAPGVDNKTIRNKDSTQSFNPISDGINVSYDIGLLIVADNPFNKSKRLVVCAGSYTYGTAAAMQFLLSNECGKHLRKSGERFLCVVGCKVDNAAIRDVRLISQVYTKW